jgi:hypothetical protein
VVVATVTSPPVALKVCSVLTGAGATDRSADEGVGDDVAGFAAVADGGSALVVPEVAASLGGASGGAAGPDPSAGGAIVIVADATVVASVLEEGRVGAIVAVDAGGSAAVRLDDRAATPRVTTKATTSSAQTRSIRRRRARRSRLCTLISASPVLHSSPLARHSAPRSSSS